MAGARNARRDHLLLAGPAFGWIVAAGLAMTGYASPVATEQSGDPPAARGPGDATAQSAARVDALIGRLGSETYVERTEAERELLALGFDAFDQLKLAESSEDPEIAARARHLTRQLTVDWTREDDSPPVRQLLQGYARLSTEQRFQRVEQLASLGEQECVDALCRIVRFDESNVVSKRAALAVMDAVGTEAPEVAQRARTIRENIGTSRRVAADWLRTYCEQLRDSAESVTSWQEYADEELAKPAEGNRILHKVVAIGLLDHLSDLYEELDRDEELVEVLLKMVELDETGSANVLERLVERLIRTKNWTAVDKIVDRFADRFRDDPLLMYMLAEARREQGDLEKSQELADIAFKLSAQNALRVDLAEKLVDRGLYEWAEREYRHVLANEPAISDEGLFAVSWLTAMLYDLQEHASAADLLDEFLARWEEEVEENGEGVVDRITLLGPQDIADQLQQLKARADYNRACHARLQDDRATERKYLEKAIEESPRDIDVLIAMYRLPEGDVGFRADVIRRIAAEAELLDAEARESPNQPVNYNNWAWLIANTQGDYDKAVRYAQRAVELARRESSLAGYLDTLARAYFAKGDLEQALRHQRRAAELDPHTQQLQRQLAEFEQAAGERGITNDE